MSLGCSCTSTQFNLLDWLIVRGRNRFLSEIQMASFILPSSTHIFRCVYIIYFTEYESLTWGSRGGIEDVPRYWFLCAVCGSWANWTRIWEVRMINNRCLVIWAAEEISDKSQLVRIVKSLGVIHSDVKRRQLLIVVLYHFSECILDDCGWPTWYLIMVW